MTIPKLKPPAGGKYDEVNEFAHLIPGFNNYYEPFFGGGGVFFAIRPKGIAFINDRSIDLIKFYQFLQNCEFKDHLYLYSEF